MADDANECDDGNPCTDDACMAGSCVGESDDSNSCPSGTCHDGTCCTGCWDGVTCLAGSAPSACGLAGADCIPCADDDNPCTDSVCIAGVCSQSNDDTNECDDGNACTDDSCSAGACLGVANDSNTCTAGVCHGGACCMGCWDGTTCLAGSSVAACGTSGAPCSTCSEDANPCTDAACIAGACGQANDDSNTCDDGNPCTDDSCTGGACVGAPDDSNGCTGGSCRSGMCCGGCWDGASCLSGTSDLACGAAGALCTSCGVSGLCTSGACGPRYALSFDGDGDEVEFPMSFGDPGSRFTIEAWVRPDTGAGGTSEGEGTSIFMHRAACTDFNLEWSGSADGRSPDRFRFRVYPLSGTCSWVAAESAFTSPVATWHHVAGVFDDGTVRLYVDGALAGSAAVASPVSWTTAVLGHWAGRDGADGRPTRGAFIGQIDELRVSHVARYAGASFTPPDHLDADADTVGAWLFDEGAGTMAGDAGTGGLDGIITGASWVTATR